MRNVDGRQAIRYRSVGYDSARWEAVPLRDGDILVCTPPKCGTTWMQRICSLLVFAKPELDRPLTSISPWVDMLTLGPADLAARLAAQTHRRFLKTHTPFDGLPWHEGVTYVCVARDPRDVAVSWDAHMANTDFDALFAARDAAVGNADIADMLAAGPPPQPETERGRFLAFLDDLSPVTESVASLAGVLHHLHSFWTRRDRPQVVMVRYADLERDLEGGMRALAARLGIAIPEDRWPALVEAAGFEAMRRDAERTAPGVTEGLWKDAGRFFRSGRSGGWKELFPDDEVPHYVERAREIVDDEDFLAWVHDDWPGLARTRRERGRSGR